MSSRHVETERTYDLPDDAMVLPDLVAATDGTIHAVTDVGTDELEATYVDTDDLQLIRRRVTLRRRTGGVDAGWHLKLPVQDDTRQEIHWPLGDGADLPEDVRRAVTALAPGAQLRPVVRLATTRQRRLLTGEAGATLAELCDDRVSATLLDGAAGVTVWREVEVELVDGSTADLDAVESALLAVGAVRAATPSKLARALAGHPALVDPAPHPTGTAGGVLLAYLREQLDRLRWADVDLRLDPDGEGVHDLRVQARRLRTALAVNRRLVDEPAARHLEHELKLLGRVLSPVRDLQVVRQLLAQRIESLAPEQAHGVLRLLDQELAPAMDRTAAGMRSALDAQRYVELLVELEALAGGTGLTDLAHEPVSVMLADLGTALRRLEKAARTAGAQAPGEATDGRPARPAQGGQAPALCL